MHIALIGASGYVGSEFTQQINDRGHQMTAIGRSNCDVYSVSSLLSVLEDASPDILINCAGYTGKPNVDACELDKANCIAGNTVLPGVIQEACETIGIPWGHVSSGCIFTGRRADGNGFTELDEPNFSFRQNNCSWYSGTKALGEEVLAGASKCYIWRLRIPFSNIDSPRNYLSKVQRYENLLEAENSLSNLPEYVAAALDCFEKNVPFGTYNLTNPGSVATSEVVEMIKEAGVSDKEFRFFDSEDEFMAKAAKTPRSNCVMDSSKALVAGLKLTPIHDCIRATLAQWQPEAVASDEQRVAT
ncbi:dTDP-4-dehydrorhamnose reductase [Stieleria neptunia]|uniref:dTDP-4-dehydrorhamnose reductase n=1 Tax=Stieleria neptunia TaxID=2527979 RepID=A0A518HQU5_9BACT|nr:sugar nucleotide-binding protein [Stieleria neptunia]QDV43220.1 dTDP-4-dehydrorhamnose reductase [Stieleria neptunia]